MGRFKSARRARRGTALNARLVKFGIKPPENTDSIEVDVTLDSSLTAEDAIENENLHEVIADITITVDLTCEESAVDLTPDES